MCPENIWVSVPCCSLAGDFTCSVKLDLPTGDYSGDPFSLTTFLPLRDEVEPTKCCLSTQQHSPTLPSALMS